MNSLAASTFSFTWVSSTDARSHHLHQHVPCLQSHPLWLTSRGNNGVRISRTKRDRTNQRPVPPSGHEPVRDDRDGLLLVCELEERILEADKVARNILRARRFENVDGLVVLVRNWERAGFVNGGLIADLDLRNFLAEKEGTDDLIALFHGNFDHVAYDWVLFALTEDAGESISEDCLIQTVLATLYSGRAAPRPDVSIFEDRQE